MNLNTFIEKHKPLVQKKMLQVTGGHEPVSLYEPMTYAVSGGGKMLRPIMALLSSQAVGGTTDDALDAAAAIELVHNFTLVHDDIMDNDDLRRGRETVYKKWDENVAILSGDGLLVLAYRLISEQNKANLQTILQTFSNGILDVCEGQALDKDFEIRSDVCLDEYYTMIDKKTSALFATACQIGGLCGKGSPEQVAALKEYGMGLGRAFQIQDDMLDVIADEKVLGKNVGSDLQENKKTYLILHAFQNANDSQKKLLSKSLRGEKLSQEEMQLVIKVFNETGTMDAARLEINEALSRAEISLEKTLQNEATQNLCSLLDIIKKRNS